MNLFITICVHKEIEGSLVLTATSPWWHVKLYLKLSFTAEISYKTSVFVVWVICMHFLLKDLILLLNHLTRDGLKLKGVTKGPTTRLNRYLSCKEF